MTFLCLKIPLFHWKFRSVRSVRYVRYHYVHTTYGCVCCKIIDPKFPVKSRNFGLLLRSKPLQVPSSAPGRVLTTKVSTRFYFCVPKGFFITGVVNTRFFYFFNVQVDLLAHISLKINFAKYICKRFYNVIL